MHENLKIQTGKSKDKINILNDVKRDVIVNKVDTGKINNIYKIKSKRKILIRWGLILYWVCEGS